MYSASPKRVETLTEADNGREVQLRVGDALELRLRANPTTGFQWEVVSMNARLLRSRGEQQSEPSVDMLGSAGRYSLHLEAIAPGRSALKLAYRRPFEEDTTAALVFEVSVVIQ